MNMDNIKQAFLESVRFPPYTPLPDWVEQNIVLSARACPTPGLMQLWKQQRGILEAIDNPAITRISVMKAARLGYTKSIMGVIGHYASNHPCSVLLLLPTEDDCNRMSRDEVAPMFQESPALKNLLSSRQGPGDRDSLTAKYYINGGSLKIVAARAPRNLRSHDVKILLLDEIDVYEITAEGDAVELAVRRTLAHPDRKIIAGSSPSLDGESPIQRLWELSDKRIFEVPCPHCEVPFEIQMEHLTWPPERPEEAYIVCPSCGCVIEESFKPQMVALGEWRATEPQVKGHAGFRMNAFISLFENASWANIAQEYLTAQLGGPSTMRVFENVVLGKCSTLAIDSVDASSLASRTEDFSLQKLPADCLLITAGCDVQGDRIECTFLGHALDGQQFILAHIVLMGNTAEAPVWASLDR
jgi:phage terminase large subunit GpA-like protein